MEAKRAEGELVWLQFASDWDLKGHVNEKRLFSDERFPQNSTEHRVYLMRADHTKLDREISDGLKKIWVIIGANKPHLSGRP